MKDFEGTPGPWHVSFHGSDNCWIVDSGNDSAVAKVTRYKGSGEIQKANFQLIAAAPEILELLLSFPGFTDNANIGDEWIEVKNRVIAKALGQ